MHRELSRSGVVFDETRDYALYLLTALLALLIGRDLAPPFVQWLGTLDIGVGTNSWSRELYGFRYAAIAAVIGGARVLFSSLEGLFEGRFVADLAIAIAAIAAILLGEPLVAAEVVFIGMVGECLEAFTVARTQRGIRKLVEVFPQRCWLLRDGQEVRIFTNEVRVGDRVVVKPGGKIPVDGVVVDGRSWVDASPLTGESVPLDRSAGDDVLAGCINQNGQLTIEAKKVAAQTVAGRVIELTSLALRDKAPIERQVDRLAKWFLPAVLLAAILVFFFNVLVHTGPFRATEARLPLATALRLALYPTLGVLVVACPCALVLATPAAVIAALGRLAGTGILIKGGAALERLGKVQAFAFDKTGTLTEGRLELGEVIALNGVDEDAVLQAAAQAEQGSEHPLGRLIVHEATARSLPLDPLAEFQAYPGAGIAATCRETQLVIGTRRFLEERGIALTDDAVRALAHLDELGQSSLLVARAGEVIGLIGARDRVRLDAADMLQELRNAGISRIALLTGDRAAVAHAVGEQLKIDDIRGELMPADKAACIEAMPQAAFVGDGINDAPALARASVGIAVGGTEIAADAGDIVALGEPLRHLPMLLRLSRETLRIIRQNIIVYAFAVNAIGIMLTGVIWPMFATSPELYDKAPLVGVLYHQLGSLLVLLNSMRLLAFERAPAKAWSRWKESATLFDLWMERNLNIDHLLHEAAHRWRVIAGGCAIVLAACWIGAGLIVVEPDEIAVVQQFGRVQANAGPGLHWRWPWPIDNVRKVKPDEVKVVLIDFRPRSADEDESDSAAIRDSSDATWTSVHGDPNRPLGVSLFTGDRNLIDVLASVHYTIDNPQQYLFAAKQPRALIRSAAEGTLREIVAGRTFMDLLTSQRLDLQQQTAERLRQRLRELNPDGIGVHISGVVIHDMHPVLRVAKDYYRLAKAIQEREQQRHRANTTAALIKSRAIENEIVTINEAERKANEQVEDARASAAELRGWQLARQQPSAQQQWELFERFVGSLSYGRDYGTALRELQMEELMLIDARRTLIDFNLVWNTITSVFQGRDKVIIDADQVRGKVQLFLFDPDLIRPAMVSPSNRGEK